MRDVVRVLRGSNMAFREGGATVFYSPGQKKAVMASKRTDDGVPFYSITSVRPVADVRNYGTPDWVGRLTFSTREAATTAPTTTDIQSDANPQVNGNASSHSGRTGHVESDEADAHGFSAPEAPSRRRKARWPLRAAKTLWRLCAVAKSAALEATERANAREPSKALAKKIEELRIAWNTTSFRTSIRWARRGGSPIRGRSPD